MRQSKRDLQIQKAKEKLQNEIDIVKILQQLRFFDRAIKVILGDKKVVELKEASLKFLIDLDDNKF